MLGDRGAYLRCREYGAFKRNQKLWALCGHSAATDGCANRCKCLINKGWRRKRPGGLTGLQNRPPSLNSQKCQESLRFYAAPPTPEWVYSGEFRSQKRIQRVPNCNGIFGTALKWTLHGSKLGHLERCVDRCGQSSATPSLMR